MFDFSRSCFVYALELLPTYFAHFLRPSYGVIAQFLGTSITNFRTIFAFLPMKENFLEFEYIDHQVFMCKVLNT